MPYSSGGGSHSSGSHGGGGGGSHSYGGSSHSSGSWSSSSSHSYGGSSHSHDSSDYSYHSSSSSSSSRNYSYPNKTYRSRQEFIDEMNSFTYTSNGRVLRSVGMTRARKKPVLKTYVYYRNKKPIYVSTYNDINEESYPRRNKTIMMILLTILAAIFAVLLITSFYMPKKLSTSYANRYSDKYGYIEDNASAIGDISTTSLVKEMKEFYNASGVRMIIVTVYNDDWQYSSRYNDLEDYALDYYLYYINDESSWLLVYSTSKNNSSGFDDWYFEFIQGNDTSKILSKRLTRKVIDKAQTYFMASEHLTTVEAMTKIVQAAESELFKLEVKWAQLIISIIIDAGSVLLIVYLYKKRKNDFDRSELVLVENDKNGKPKEFICEYCGGKYAKSTQTSCPHCGGTIVAIKKEEPEGQENAQSK